MPRRDILVDSQGNRLLVGGDYAFSDGQQAVGQGVQLAVGLWLGEYWLDESIGVDYIGKILVKGPTPVVVSGELARAIAGVADVTRVASAAYVAPSANRTGASVTFDVATTSGPLVGSTGAPS